MNKLTTILLVLLSFSCINDNQLSNTFKDIAKLEEPEIINRPQMTMTNEVINIADELYDLQIKIETSDNDNHNLVIAIDLHNDSYYISPNAKRDFKGKFFMDFGSYNNISFDGNIIETPRSVEEYDPHPFTNGLVNWVHVNTSYKQPLKLKSHEDFEVFGRVRFTIEPRCTLEEIPFAISYKNGVMKIYSPKC